MRIKKENRPWITLRASVMFSLERKCQFFYNWRMKTHSKHVNKKLWCCKQESYQRLGCDFHICTDKSDFRGQTMNFNQKTGSSSYFHCANFLKIYPQTMWEPNQQDKSDLWSDQDLSFKTKYVLNNPFNNRQKYFNVKQSHGTTDSLCHLRLPVWLKALALCVVCLWWKSAWLIAN